MNCRLIVILARPSTTWAGCGAAWDFGLAERADARKPAKTPKQEEEQKRTMLVIANLSDLSVWSILNGLDVNIITKEFTLQL